jgi:hypothetical protein
VRRRPCGGSGTVHCLITQAELLKLQKSGNFFMLSEREKREKEEKKGMKRRREKGGVITGRRCLDVLVSGHFFPCYLF